MSDPEVEATLVNSGSVWLWVIKKCPFCGVEHVHGGGNIKGDPRKLLGSRSAHCNANSVGGYILVEQLPSSVKEKRRKSYYTANVRNLIEALSS